MDRDTILSSFQEISQIQDFEECIQILESVNWDLQKAVDSIDQFYLTPQVESRAENSFSAYSPISEVHFYEPNRELKFNVIVKGKTLSMKVAENKTVGELAHIVANEINEPNARFQIKGLKNPYDENTILRNMKLPLINNVSANPVDVLNFHKTGSSSNEHGPKLYHLAIEIFLNGDSSQTLPLTFTGKDSVGKVKSQLAYLTGTETSCQTWSGWPKNICGSETTLEDSGLSDDAKLTVHIKVENKTTRRVHENTTNASVEASLNNSREIDNDDDDDDDYFADDIELAENETEISKKRSAALMDANAHLDPVTAVCQFNTEFEARYCSSLSKADSTVSSQMMPPFFLGSMDDAISQTLNLTPHERKPLFLYLHHGGSIQANIFCTQILCYSEVCLFFIQSGYTIWPWDVTYPDNKSKLFTWLTKHFGPYIYSSLKVINKDHFPVMVVLCKSQGTIEMMEVLDGMRTKEEIVSHLWDIRSKFHEKQQPDIHAWEERQLRDLVKQEQDAAYQESLLLDQQKDKLKSYEDQKVKDAEVKASQEIEKVKNERQNRIANAERLLPAEPADGPDTVTIRLRAPSNIAESPTAMTRRFLYSHSLAHLVSYMESLGFLRSEFKLLTAYPKKNLTDLPDHSITLKQLGIPKRETLTLEML